jgi:hypothetical protein
MGQHTEARVAGHLKEVLGRFELTDGRLLAIAPGNASSNNSMTRKLQTTLVVSGI